jgi:hypothetical protein
MVTVQLSLAARHAAAELRDVAAAERDRDAARRALREKALDALDNRDPHGRAAFVRRDALVDRQASASDRLASASDRAAERYDARP